LINPPPIFLEHGALPKIEACIVMLPFGPHFTSYIHEFVEPWSKNMG